MECTLFREQLFSTDIVNYIVNFDFNQFSSVLNRDTGVVGGIDASRLQAATSSSDENKRRQESEINLSMCRYI